MSKKFQTQFSVLLGFITLLGLFQGWLYLRNIGKSAQVINQYQPVQETEQIPYQDPNEFLGNQKEQALILAEEDLKKAKEELTNAAVILLRHCLVNKAFDLQSKARASATAKGIPPKIAFSSNAVAALNAAQAQADSQRKAQQKPENTALLTEDICGGYASAYMSVLSATLAESGTLPQLGISQMPPSHEFSGYDPQALKATQKVYEKALNEYLERYAESSEKSNP